LTLSSAAHASKIEQAFKLKNYKEVTRIYLQSAKKRWSYSEMIKISYSLRTNHQYRQSIGLSLRIISERFKKKHQEVIRKVRKGEVLDPDEYPKALKILYWNIFRDYSHLIKQEEKITTRLETDLKHFTFFYKILSDLEFREQKIDKTNDETNAYVKGMKDRIYRLSYSVSFQYVSWQRSAFLYSTTNDDKFDLLITNEGYCLGGDVGLENEFHHFFVDGCLLVGAGGASSHDPQGPTYKQPAVPAYGFKGGLGYSKIVSSSKSRIGIKIPFIFTIQNLEAPLDETFSIDSRPQLDFLLSLYSRWHLDKWYFQTEFGKYFQKEDTFWGLGFGRSF